MLVYCTKSRNDPDPLLLKVLANTAEERKHKDKMQEVKKQQNEPESGPHKAVIFELSSLSCGHYEFPQGHLTYFPDEEWTAQEISNGVIKFAKHLMIVTFSYAGFGRIRLEMPYRTINEIVRSIQSHSMTLTLWESPRIYEESDSDEITQLVAMLGLSNGRAPGAARTRLHEIPHRNDRHGEILGQTLVYSFAVSPTDFYHKIGLLKGKQVLTLTAYNFAAVPLGHRRMDLTTGLKDLKDALDMQTPMIPFDIKFQFQVLVQNGYLMPQTVQKLLYRLRDVMVSRQGSRCPISSNAIRKLQRQINFPGPETEASEFSEDELWDYLVSNEKKVRQELNSDLLSERARQNLVMVYKIQVTPTRVLLQGPEPEAKNRILRKFPNYTQYFARVQFCEEDGQDLFFNSRISLEKIWRR